MTTLYRTTNLVIDAHEWHAAVKLRDKRVTLTYYWRPLSAKVRPWSKAASWKGPKPKDLCNRFWMFRDHIRKALASEQARLEELAILEARKTPATAAQVRNGWEAAA